MTQLSLTDDRITAAAQESHPAKTKETNRSPPKTGDPVKDNRSIEGHPAVANINIEQMELETSAEGWRKFPHPEAITSHLDEDMDADKAVFPDGVSDAIESLTGGDASINEFLVMDPDEVYEYLESLQRKSDLHLENFERRQLVVNQLSNGRGYAKGASLSTYDKRWICQWEVRRRLAVREFDEWTDRNLTKEHSTLPNAKSPESEQK